MVKSLTSLASALMVSCIVSCACPLPSANMTCTDASSTSATSSPAPDYYWNDSSPRNTIGAILPSNIATEQLTPASKRTRPSQTSTMDPNPPENSSNVTHSGTPFQGTAVIPKNDTTSHNSTSASAPAKASPKPAKQKLLHLDSTTGPVSLGAGITSLTVNLTLAKAPLAAVQLAPKEQTVNTLQLGILRRRSAANLHVAKQMSKRALPVDSASAQVTAMEPPASATDSATTEDYDPGNAVLARGMKAVVVIPRAESMARLSEVPRETFLGGESSTKGTARRSPSARRSRPRSRHALAVVGGGVEDKNQSKRGGKAERSKVRRRRHP